MLDPWVTRSRSCRSADLRCRRGRAMAAPLRPTPDLVGRCRRLSAANRARHLPPLRAWTDEASIRDSSTENTQPGASSGLSVRNLISADRRVPPSSRITSPFRYGLPTMASTRSAYSSGRPSRFGNRTSSISSSCRSGDETRGVRKPPGAIAQHADTDARRGREPSEASWRRSRLWPRRTGPS